MRKTIVAIALVTVGGTAYANENETLFDYAQRHASSVATPVTQGEVVSCADANVLRTLYNQTWGHTKEQLLKFANRLKIQTQQNETIEAIN